MPEWLLQLLPTAAAGVGVYAAIRADLAALHAHVQNAQESANRANQRIDVILERAS